jgi:L-alanine-DL-glutamate epimerase-like enolase superfamily enzyme
MRASQFRAGSAPVAFRVSFGHAAAIRDRAENVLVAIEDAEGRKGLGEGCPRSYVTGESIPGALAFLAAHRESILAIEGLRDLKAWIAANAAAIDKNPSAFCAAELALIDLFARQAGQDLETFLGIARGPDPICVSAVYGSGKGATFRLQSALFGLNGMRDSKLKITGHLAQDLPRAKSLARRGLVRLDANNLWPDAETALPALAALARHAWAVEEPVKPRDWPGLSRIARETGLAIILDESLLTLRDLEGVPQDISVIPNLRVSKQGGLLRSLELLAHASDRIIVGAQVGETSILGRAGLALAHAAAARLTGFECAYAPLLLSSDVVKPSLGFGRCGRIRQDKVNDRPGFGLSLTSTF